MKHFRAPTIFVGGLAVVALLAGNAVANTAVFNGSYAGTTTEKVNGQKITVVPTSRGCAASEDDRDNISLAGSVKVRGGTLKFRTAHGTLRFTGHYNRATGAFNVKLKGTLKF